MPKNDRRNAHCYALTRDKIRLGWWERQQFRTIAARLRDLSVSGALIELEEGAACPAGVKTWICLAGQSPPNWVQAESKTVEDCKDIPGTSRVLRLKFLETFPYESFKTAVWDDGAAGTKTQSRCRRQSASLRRRRLRKTNEPRQDDQVRAYWDLLATRPADRYIERSRARDRGRQFAASPDSGGSLQKPDGFRSRVCVLTVAGGAFDKSLCLSSAGASFQVAHDLPGKTCNPTGPDRIELTPPSSVWLVSTHVLRARPQSRFFGSTLSAQLDLITLLPHWAPQRRAV